MGPSSWLKRFPIIDIINPKILIINAGSCTKTLLIIFSFLLCFSGTGEREAVFPDEAVCNCRDDNMGIRVNATINEAIKEKVTVSA